MGNYIVSARKYRPGTFASVVGQRHITSTLQSAILMDQLAHAFLFSGPRGVGKTTCARILAKAINCENLGEDGEPCNECDSCISYNEGKSINIHELDAASNNSVDDIRNLIEQTRYVPPNGKKSVYIIDEVHMLSQAAFNAFLKTLEEPPPHVLFILATTEKHKILPTILSRCQKFDFRRIKVEDIARHLEYIAKEEKQEHEFAALQQIALKADGALRDALSLYDQLTSYATGPLTFKDVLENLNILDYDYYFSTVRHMSERTHGELLVLLNEIIEKGFEAKDFIVGLTAHFRNLLVAQDPQTVQLLETSENVKREYLEQSRAMEPTLLLNAFHLCSEAEQQARFATHPRLVVELLLIKLAHLASAVEVASDPQAASELVKKKPIAEQKVATTSNSPAEIPPKAPPKKETPPVEPQIPPPPAPKTPASVSVSGNGHSKPPVSTTKPKGMMPSLKLSNTFEGMQPQLKEIAEAAKSSEETEENLTYDVDPTVQVPEKEFHQHLGTFLEGLKKQNKMNLVSAFQGGKTSFEHNKWILLLENEIFMSLVASEKSLLPYLREQLNIPHLFLEARVDASAQPKQEIPYTEEDKLKVMSEKNPNLKKLQEIFKTRIIY